MKKLKGTDQPARMKGEMELPVISKLPPAPSWFNSFGKKIYSEKGRLMIGLGLLNVVNFELFVAYVNQLGIHFEAEEYLSKGLRYDDLESKAGNYSVVKAYQKISNDALKMAKSLGAEFGLTPAAATRVHLPKKETKDEFEQFLNK